MTAAPSPAVPPRLTLAHLPTPLWRHDALDALVGTEVWVKRDDLSGGVTAGNKVRKLEFIVAAAREAGATALITCGALQSNHARATAAVAAELGLACVLLLRTADPARLPAPTGNHALDVVLGATVVPITLAAWRDRTSLMEREAERVRAAGGVPWIIPEGGSTALGCWGYEQAMAEVATQLARGEAGGARGAEPAFDVVVAACGSGGTAAGLALGARHHGVAARAVAIAVCDDAPTFRGIIQQLAAEAAARWPELSGRVVAFDVHDAWKGPRYGEATPEQAAFLLEVARRTGLVLDPVYTGKALFGLAQLRPRPRRALFVHTGGLPGFLAEAPALLASGRS